DGVVVDPDFYGDHPGYGNPIPNFPVVVNLTDLGVLQTKPGTLGQGDTGTILGGNFDGLTSGPDGNLYLTSFEATELLPGQPETILPQPFVNGLWRFRVS